MSKESRQAKHNISTLNEKPLHAALKEWYARPGDRFEVPVDGYLVDIVRDGLLIEIQTRGFSPLKRKLGKLAETHPVRLVYPIARDKWIVRRAKRGKKVLGRSSRNGLGDATASPGRRKSPKHGAVEDLFEELVSIPKLLTNPNFALDVLLIHEEEVRRHDAARAWRRKGWVTHERRLLDVVDRRLFETPADLAALVPDGLAEPFTTADLADAIARPRWLAQKMAYCLRQMGAIHPVGKRGRTILYARRHAPRPRTPRRTRTKR